MLNIVLFGPPGAGKGTQSEKLIAAYQLVHLSTGDILRAEIAAGTERGIEAKKIMDEGVLVPDEVVIGMISSKLDQHKDAKGFIFDGFPRTVAQAEALDKLLAEKNTAITLMVALDVTDEELTKRLLLRGKDSGRPDDTNEEIINRRISEYNKKTAPLKDYYSAQSKFESVKGIGSIDEIFESLCNAINFIQSEATSDVKPEETVVSKIASFVKNVFTPNDDHSSKNGSPKKTAVKKPAVKASAKEETAASRKNPNTPAKRIASNAAKKSAVKKIVKKAPVKKAVKKTAKKAAAKKSGIKPVKKAAAKKAAVNKVRAKKSASKKALKKVIKKAAKKSLPKPLKKKTAVKKFAIKNAPKKTAKKAASRTAPKKAAAKKAVKKIVKKTAVKKIVKKAAVKKMIKRPSAKKIASKKVSSKNKKLPSKKAAAKRK